MEPPNSWSLLEGSLAVGDLNNPAFVWAFLVVQGLVRDLPGDRQTFYAIVSEERACEITGPGVFRRVSFALRDAGILLPASDFPDPNAELAQERRELLAGWMKAVPVKFSSGHGLFCVYCGFNVGDTPNGLPCPNCDSPIPASSATRGKPCLHCEEPNLLFASFCEYCGGRLVIVHCYQCGSEVQPQSHFCPTCGIKITATYATAGEAPTTIITTSEPSGQRINGEGAGKTTRYDPQTNTLETEKISDRVTELVTEPAVEKPQKSFQESRFFRLYNKSTDPEQVAKKADDLLIILTSAVQDIVVMKEMLQEKGIWDEAQYRELRTRRMIADHSSLGANPWVAYSLYPYTLEEPELLRQQFNANDEEVQKFEERVEHIETLT